MTDIIAAVDADSQQLPRRQGPGTGNDSASGAAHATMPKGLPAASNPMTIPSARNGVQIIRGALHQSERATMDAMRHATGWQAHSVRGLHPSLRRGGTENICLKDLDELSCDRWGHEISQENQS